MLSQQALCELISNQERWCHVEYTGLDQYQLKFNADGTGEVIASGDLGTGTLIVPSMTLKVLPCSKTAAEVLSNKIFMHKNWLTKPPELLGYLRLEIQLSPAVPKRFQSKHNKWPTPNDLLLSDAAYIPRQFTVVIEKGSFSAVHLPERHGLRMTFDVSPYPAPDGFRTEDPRYTDERGRGWIYRSLHRVPAVEDWTWLCDLLNGRTSYYAGKSPAELSSQRATDDDLFWGYHTSSCVIL